MSNNGIPPLNDWQADNYPVIYDEGDEETKYVKDGNKIAIPGGSSGYLSYVALLTQTGTEAFAPTVLTNTIGVITSTRSATGRYRLVSDGLFTAGKTFIPGLVDFGANGDAGSRIILYSGPNTIVGTINIAFDETDIDTIYISVRDQDGVDVDFVTIAGASVFQIEIRVYP